jgi:phosphomevalonate kinase
LVQSAKNLGNIYNRATILSFVFKAIFNKYLEKKLEEFKIEKQFEIENFKSQLQSIVKQNEITFSTLHRERANVLKDLYIKLYELESEMPNLIEKITYSDQKNKSEFHESIKLLKDFDSYYNKNNLFLTGEVDNLVQDYVNSIRRTIKKANEGANSQEHAKRAGLGNVTNFELYEIGTKLNRESIEEMAKKIPELKGEIKMEFQKILLNN